MAFVELKKEDTYTELVRKINFNFASLAKTFRDEQTLEDFIRTVIEEVTEENA